MEIVLSPVVLEEGTSSEPCTSESSNEYPTLSHPSQTVSEPYQATSLEPPTPIVPHPRRRERAASRDSGAAIVSLANYTFVMLQNY